MSEMVDKVAKAMAFDQGITWDGGSGEYPGQDELRAMARAAIEAMMEPTDEVLKAGSKEMNHGPKSTIGVYQAMITAALEE